MTPDRIRAFKRHNERMLYMNPPQPIVYLTPEEFDAALHRGFLSWLKQRCYVILPPHGRTTA